METVTPHGILEHARNMLQKQPHGAHQRCGFYDPDTGCSDLLGWCVRAAHPDLDRSRLHNGLLARVVEAAEASGPLGIAVGALYASLPVEYQHAAAAVPWFQSQYVESYNDDRPLEVVIGLVDRAKELLTQEAKAAAA